MIGRKCKYVDNINHCSKCGDDSVHCCFTGDNHWVDAKVVCKFYDEAPLFVMLDDQEHFVYKAYNCRENKTTSVILTREQFDWMRWALNQENNGLPDW
jgi:regulation of enolase protein 1 (concanavalin A-like superfamily)